ncbi:MAG TPA: LPS export ABC transporter periplasmic protein LptC [Burkholderiaceae bacterium]|nr:LPS export ABC transporter periplasmic protein LptC [Burkholderiaceae bacterium]
MNAPAGGRFRLPVLMVLALGLAVGSFWLLEVLRQDRGAPESTTARSAPDYYVQKFEFIRMNENGQPRYRVSGVQLLHYPLDNSSEIEAPVINQLQKDKPPMMIRADRARIEDENSKTHMRGNVIVDRPATPMAQYFHLESEYLLVLPDEDIVETDLPVHILFGQSVLDGTGMYANNATREFRLSSRVHGTYRAPPR